MTKRTGDSLAMTYATKGYEARQQHINKFMDDPRFDYIFLMDADMIFPENTLERLRGHNLPFVSGLYMRRRYAPIAPIWFESMPAGTANFKWWTGKIEPDTLYPIGASGWGCMLIHRSVIEAVRPMLKGEAEVIEDDMDIFPYNLARITDALRGIENAFDIATAHDWVKVLRQEIRPLRVMKGTVGSDVRFPFFAKLAGYQLIGDSGAPCGHMLNYPLSPSDYPGMFEHYTPDMTQPLTDAMLEAWNKEQAAIEKATAEL
jgi:hypothetical protein